ncbi:MAG: type I 3-dehydroquinate dehydratase [Candidatus Bathycorpusculaceae bacterium]
MTPRICISIIPWTVDEALKLIERAEKYKPDFVEVRMDRLKENEELATLAGCTKIPLIATNRAKNCGGEYSGSETQRLLTLLKAVKEGFEYVDIELSAPGLKHLVNELRQIEAKPIISFHDFKKTPSTLEMQRILKSQIENGAEICKIIGTARALEDNLKILSFLGRTSKNSKVVGFAMGPLGKISRLLSPFFGGFFTIASLERGGETAMGQMTIEELKVAYKALGLLE